MVDEILIRMGESLRQVVSMPVLNTRQPIPYGTRYFKGFPGCFANDEGTFHEMRQWAPFQFSTLVL
jgi:hypothetical protein